MNDDNLFIMDILNSSQKGMYIVDNQKKYVYANNTFLSILGISREELIGHSVYEFRDKGKYDTCVSDIVFREKNYISIFGNIAVNSNGVIRNERLMINATPVYDQFDNIEYVHVEIELVSDINARFHEATARNLSFESSSFNTAITKPYSQRMTGTSIIANSHLMKKVLSTSLNIANVDTTVLISGATGTGKEIIAEYIHENSNRKEYPMIVINCASIPENLLESTLFGYDKGSFSGASPTGKTGLIEQANRGTLFLDEINSLPLGLQGKILRVIETKKIQRIGSSKELSVDFRLLTATNENLKQKVLNGTFRSDLYYRINILPIHLPRLAERKEDIIPLTQHFNEMYCKKYNKNRIFSSDALNKIVLYNWPGNIRELRNAIERAIVMTDHEYIDSADIDSIIDMQKNELQPSDSQELYNENVYLESLLEQNVSLQDYINDCEKNYLSTALNKYDSTYKAAKALGTNQSLIMRRKKQYNL
ncbi:sigma 54-interacting transcriptional regulator [Psychrobacillus sp. NEAU-3TGS]|uniref:sigma-54 interaction domain-containing protein n=1 Tax=Psychrobacillus sp. NEAU-3TGS TaxID=2995412 RepID=UPI002495DF8B|nr:sigma 54-interacting transcriptional regulator [Psychrobacillus sp. NEAU-3TGS]MDI2588467.1 sigma 54-interacting transcriptional regulator [Psychrobacillus sp. NEAU-3TGS]